ncbi:MAG TPA: DinB family protein [Fimbriimonadaceae bacterium]|jgi:hypothetical protein
MTREVAAAVEEVNQMGARLLRDFANVPEDRLNWTPSPTARSPLALVAHCGFSLGFICELLSGKPFAAPTTEQADAEHLALEKTITTRQQALDLWRANLTKYIALLESMSEEDMAKMVTLPFGLGAAPMSYMVSVGAIHTREHVAQLEYLQTVYGDRVW